MHKESRNKIQHLKNRILLKADPWQLNNVVADPAYAQVKEDLRGRLLDWIEKAEGCRPVITD